MQNNSKNELNPGLRQVIVNTDTSN